MASFLPLLPEYGLRTISRQLPVTLPSLYGQYDLLDFGYKNARIDYAKSERPLSRSIFKGKSISFMAGYAAIILI